MSPRLKSFLQYTVIIFLTIFLIWFSLRGLKVGEDENKWEYLLNTWNKADKFWLLAMAALALFSHFIRALRWKMLIAPTGHQARVSSSFVSLMVGYLVNLAIPRGGEISRCYNLYKLDHVPVEVSFGTVVIERIIDLICLIALIVLAFVLESGKLIAFIETLPWNSISAAGKIEIIIALLAGVSVVLLISILVIKRSKKISEFITRTWLGIKKGLMSIFQLEKKGLFVFYSVMIWLLYFMMSYTVIMAFEATAHLGFSAVISLFGIGSIAMAVPLPGGTGSYHVLVPQGLVFLYGISSSDAVAFTFIFHGWQTLIMIVGGGLSLVATSFLVKKSIAD